jgi:hypothetical protein
VLVDLTAVVAAEHDVEPWGTERPIACVSRHRRPLEGALVPFVAGPGKIIAGSEFSSL